MGIHEVDTTKRGQDEHMTTWMHEERKKMGKGKKERREQKKEKKKRKKSRSHRERMVIEKKMVTMIDTFQLQVVVCWAAFVPPTRRGTKTFSVTIALGHSGPPPWIARIGLSDELHQNLVGRRPKDWHSQASPLLSASFLSAPKQPRFPMCSPSK